MECYALIFFILREKSNRLVYIYQIRSRDVSDDINLCYTKIKQFNVVGIDISAYQHFKN